MPPSDADVLVVSTAVDVATDVVVGLLRQRGVQAHRLNTEDFPFRSLVSWRRDRSARSGVLGFGESTRDPLSRYRSIWYRRVRAPTILPEMADGIHEYCVRETRAVLLGAVLAHEARIMSSPTSVWAAEHKLLQLQVAASLGLEAPETIVTNDPSVILETFGRFRDRMIVKPVRRGFLECEGEQYAIYTSRVLKAHLDDVESAKLCPSIYQPLIDKRSDVRITVVGNQMFGAEISSQTDPQAAVDWRRTENPNLPHDRFEVPSALATQVRLLMDRLGLKFGALDFVRTPDDRLIFLEVNPNGQWVWLDDALDLGISQAVAAWLADGED